MKRYFRKRLPVSILMPKFAAQSIPHFLIRKTSREGGFCRVSMPMSRHTAIVIIVLLACAALYRCADPMQTWWMPECPFHRLTGWWCAVCGLQRGLYALMHGRCVEAWLCNPFLFTLAPLLTVMAYAEIREQDAYARSIRKRLCTRWAYAALTFAALLWTVVRNRLGV